MVFRIVDMIKKDFNLKKGKEEKFLNLNSMRNKWSYSLFNKMLQNFWIPEKVDLSTDKNQYKELTPGMRNLVKNVLSYLIFLDSLQITFLSRFSSYIADVEINFLLSQHMAQESLHSKSYQVLLEGYMNEEERQEVYNKIETNKLLKEKVETCVGNYQLFFDKENTETFLLAIITDYLIEGLFFYMGFNFFYFLAYQGMMPGTADMIKYIHRDEEVHVQIFKKIFEIYRKDSGVDYDFLVEQAQALLQTEKLFYGELLGDFFAEKDVENYLNWLFAVRMENIELPLPFKEKPENPFKTFDFLTSLESNKSNFFEVTVTNYKMSNVFTNWDF